MIYNNYLNKRFSVIVLSYIIFLSSSSSLFASGGIFGFHKPPCEEGSVHDPETHRCFYCSDGSNPIEEDILSKDKKCLGVPYIGKKCSIGKNPFYDKVRNLCVYCESGYVFSTNTDKCYIH